MRPSTFALKLSLGLLLIVTIVFFTHKKEIAGLLLFGAPYIVALLLPTQYTDFAAGLSLGALLVELPFSLFFSFFGGLFRDPKGSHGVQILSLLLFFVGLACLFAYHSDRKNMDRSRVFGAGALSLVWILLITAVVVSLSR